MKIKLKYIEIITLWVLLPLTVIGILNPFPSLLVNIPWLAPVFDIAAFLLVLVGIGHFACVGLGYCKPHRMFGHEEKNDDDDGRPVN